MYPLGTASQSSWWQNSLMEYSGPWTRTESNAEIFLMMEDFPPGCPFVVNLLMSRGERVPALPNPLVSLSQPRKKKEGRERCKMESRKAKEIYWKWGQHSRDRERSQCQGPGMGAMTHGSQEELRGWYGWSELESQRVVRDEVGE